MTKASMALLDLAGKHADGDFMKELGQFVLQRLMELEVEGRCGFRVSPTPVNSR